MANIIDITAKITNELPMVRITNDFVVTVNNRKNSILRMQAMINEEEKKAAENGEVFDEMKMMSKSFEMLVGKKSADAIEALDLPIPEYRTVYKAVMAAGTGRTMEEVESRFQ